MEEKERRNHQDSSIPLSEANPELWDRLQRERGIAKAGIVSIRFLADADLDVAIVRGVRHREPSVDFKSANEAGLEGLLDPEVLELA